jgi:hypothetical protein
MKMFPVSDFYEIRNSNTSVVRPSCDVLAHRDSPYIPVTNILADLASVQDRWLYDRSRL